MNHKTNTVQNSCNSYSFKQTHPTGVTSYLYSAGIQTVPVSVLYIHRVLSKTIQTPLFCSCWKHSFIYSGLKCSSIWTAITETGHVVYLVWRFEKFRELADVSGEFCICKTQYYFRSF